MKIRLARAIYKKALIYLLDDPLSAVDAHVGKHIFENVIGLSGCLGNTKASRILVTHQVHLLREVDHIVILDQGRIVHQGTFAELASNKQFSSIVESTEENIDSSITEVKVTSSGHINMASSEDSHDTISETDVSCSGFLLSTFSQSKSFTERKSNFHRTSQGR